MLTVTQLARRFHISRATILYYEREGLLVPARRAANGYRCYGEREIRRLQSIVAYRSFGVPVADIARLIDSRGDLTHEQLLRRQFDKLEGEIQTLRQQQKAIVSFLEHTDLLEQPMVTKDRWVDIMRAAGLSEEDMHNWHRQFEKMEPQGHREFLQSLGIEAAEIDKICRWSAA